MIKKDKIFELKIEEDDAVSGIDSISLVDEPAIEVNWMFFNKVKPEEFVIPDGEDLTYSEMITQKGQLEEELFSDGWERVKEDFVSSSPNQPSFEDTENYLIRYKYILNPQASGAPVIDTTREFCRDLLSKNLVYRVEDLESITNDLGSSAMVWRGSYNCRHIWEKITYRRGTDIVNKSSVRKGRVEGDESLDVMGLPQPDTRTSNPSFSKEKFADKPKVSLDYDGVLSTDKGKELYKELVDSGSDVYIVTARNEKEGQEVLDVAKSLRIPQSKVLFTSGGKKSEVLNRIGITKHYDNNPDVLAEIKKNSPSVEAIKFDYNVGGIGGYVDPGVKKKKKSKSFEEEFNYLYPNMIKCQKCGWEWNMKDGGTDPYVCHKCGYDNPIISKSLVKPNTFDSYSDYPDSVKNNAKAVLKYVDENGWGSCGTDVGKQRANQLANGEPISLDTVKRMYSYLSRHAVDLESSKGYDDGCGKLMYDSWGGKSALSWAESKINQSEKMSKQYFQIDNEEKRIVLGPAMIPDMKIFRKDALGNPYYVFFSAETIKMIAEKYMKNKYTDNNDQMHDGKAVKDVYVIESWIKEDQSDKSSKYGYESTPIGTWFVSMKVKNEEIWKKVKDGQLNGFSVSGFFEEVSAFTKEEMFLYKVAEILKKY